MLFSCCLTSATFAGRERVQCQCRRIAPRPARELVSACRSPNLVFILRNLIFGLGDRDPVGFYGQRFGVTFMLRPLNVGNIGSNLRHALAHGNRSENSENLVFRNRDNFSMTIPKVNFLDFCMHIIAEMMINLR